MTTAAPYRLIPLKARDGSIRAHVLVDAADFEWLSQWRWRLSSSGYAVRNERRRTFLMHRQILGLAPGDPRMGEHEDRDALNCRRSNLRIAERGQLDNQQNHGLRLDNASGFRGVYWHRRAHKWAAQAQLAGQKHYLGLFYAPEEADGACKAFRAEHMPFSDDAPQLAKAYVEHLRMLTDDELHAEGFAVAHAMREPSDSDEGSLTPYRRMSLLSAELGLRNPQEISTGKGCDVQGFSTCPQVSTASTTTSPTKRMLESWSGETS